MTTMSGDGLLHLDPFRFQIKEDRDGRHRWYLYNAAGTIVGRNAAGFPSEFEAYRDVERVREELASAPIIAETEGPHSRSDRADAPHVSTRGRR